MTRMNVRKMMRSINPKVIWNGVKSFESIHRHQLLACSGIIGTWTSLAFMYHASPKIHKVIEEAQMDLEDLPDDDIERRKEVKKKLIFDVTKEAAAPVGTALLATASMAGSSRVSTKRIAAYSALNAALDSSYKAYREKVKELRGEDTDRRVMESMAKDTAVEKSTTIGQYYIPTGKGDIPTIDKWLQIRFLCSVPAIETAFAKLSCRCQDERWVTLNDLYDALNVPSEYWPKAGDVLGWTVEGLRRGLIDHNETTTLDPFGTPVIVLSYDPEIIPYYRGSRSLD